MDSTESRLRAIGDGDYLLESEAASDAPESKEPARAMVERQLDAYNRRSLEEFCECYSEDVQVWRLGQRDPLALGIGAFRMIYQDRFSCNPNLHAHVPNRVVMGPYVVDEEIVTGLSVEPIRVVAIYRYNGEKIDRVWFVRPD